MGRFKGKKALIVGGSEGIGLALAEELIRAGAEVTIASRSREKLERAQAQLGKVNIQSLDVTSFTGAETALHEVCDRHGVPDLLVNSAGVAHPQYLDRIGVNEIDQMIDLNFRGTVYVNRILVPKMLERNSGHIVNVSSVAGYIGLFGYTAYCGSKAAVIAFSEALREELIHTGIRVSVLCPPNTRTPGLDRENRSKPKEVLANEEKVKVLEPSEVARYTLNKIEKGAFWIIPTADSQAAFYLKRFAPGILRRFVRRPAG